MAAHTTSILLCLAKRCFPRACKGQHGRFASGAARLLPPELHEAPVAVSVPHGVQCSEDRHLQSSVKTWLHVCATHRALAKALERRHGIPSLFLQHPEAPEQLQSYLLDHPADLGAVRPILEVSPTRLLTEEEEEPSPVLEPLLSVLSAFVEASYKGQLSTYRRVKELSDLRRPQLWFPAARRLTRSWRVHLGPTNSGKTHAASKRLMASSSGLYMSPLRLLAWEMYERMRRAGLRCALRTGQESIGELETATHIACTVEMAPLSLRVGVAVLDEVQLVTDGARGAAWSRALLGVQAHELHLCGVAEPPGLLELLRLLAFDCGDKLVLEEQHKRMVPLLLERSPMKGLAEVAAGDCVVHFNRRDVLLTKAELEAAGHHSPSVIYGSLPPEVRRHQARLFNDPASGQEILVASDAIGMGLNLQIRRVVFGSVRKFDGEKMRQLTPAEIRQIAGRAGRYGSRHSSCGLVAAVNWQDHAVLSAALAEGEEGSDNLVAIPSAALLPPPEVLAAFSSSLEADAGRLLPFADVIQRFLAMASTPPHYFMSGAEGLLDLARSLASVQLPPAEKLVFCHAPVAAQDVSAMGALHDFAQSYADHGHAAFPEIRLPEPPPVMTLRHLFTLEDLSKVCDVYLWLAGRFPDGFTHTASASQARQALVEAINQALKKPIADLQESGEVATDVLPGPQLE